DENALSPALRLTAARSESPQVADVLRYNAQASSHPPAPIGHARVAFACPPPHPIDLMNRVCALSLLSLAVLSACSPPARPDEGFVTVPGGRIWYHRVGHGPGTPLLLMHGGPGSSSYGLKPWLALGDERPIIIYDPLGSGK